MGTLKLQMSKEETLKPISLQVPELYTKQVS